MSRSSQTVQRCEADNKHEERIDSGLEGPAPSRPHYVTYDTPLSAGFVGEKLEGELVESNASGGPGRVP